MPGTEGQTAGDAVSIPPSLVDSDAGRVTLQSRTKSRLPPVIVSTARATDPNRPVPRVPRTAPTSTSLFVVQSVRAHQKPPPPRPSATVSMSRLALATKPSLWSRSLLAVSPWSPLALPAMPQDRRHLVLPSAENAGTAAAAEYGTVERSIWRLGSETMARSSEVSEDGFGFQAPAHYAAEQLLRAAVRQVGASATAPMARVVAPRLTS